MAKSKKKSRRSVAPRKEFNGKPVYDADEPLTLKIGRVDIRGAKVQSPEGCAAARALRRQDDKVVAAHVYRAVTLVEFKDHVARYNTPEQLCNETVKFDQTGRFDEGDFHLRPPVGQRKLGSDLRRGGERGGGVDKSRRAPSRVLSDVRPMAGRSYSRHD